jgi:hypothetical protein
MQQKRRNGRTIPRNAHGLRPKHLLRTRSRICAVSISKDFVHAGRASFKDQFLLI